MKIRSSFVGNSSSASFLFKINLSFEELCNLLENDYFDYFTSSNYELNTIIKNFIIKRMNNIKTSFDLGFSNEENYKKEVKIYTNTLNKVEELDKLDKYLYLLNEKEGINIEEEGDCTYLKWCTVILNDYASSTPEIIKELLLYEKVRNNIDTELTVKTD